MASSSTASISPTRARAKAPPPPPPPEKRKHSARRERAELVDPGPQPIRYRLTKTQTYVITYAQNATPVHKGLLTSLKAYCDYHGAQLVVIAGRYHNPTSVWTKDMQHSDWWALELHPFLFQGTQTVGDRVTIHGDTSIQPTAVRPLSGFEVYTGKYSGVFGHPKYQMRTIATTERGNARVLTTTGACTIPNYIPSKAGKKAAAHHVFGATVLELDGDVCHIRQINALSDGTFTDVDTVWTREGKHYPADRALGLVCGDIHEDQIDTRVAQATFYAADSIVKITRPRTIVTHDTLDFRRKNHHDRDRFTKRYAQMAGTEASDVREEVKNAVKFLDRICPKDTTVYVTDSNHDDAFDRWLDSIHPHSDPLNAKFYHESWLLKLERYDRDEVWRSAFSLWYEQWGKGNAKFLTGDDSLRIGGIECSLHGHNGTNGARGSPLAFSKLGEKTITGHLHTPEVCDGAYVVGVTGRLNQGYNRLPSSWAHAHVVIHALGAKRQMIFVIGGRWRRTRVKTSRKAKLTTSL